MVYPDTMHCNSDTDGVRHIGRIQKLIRELSVEVSFLGLQTQLGKVVPQPGKYNEISLFCVD